MFLLVCCALARTLHIGFINIPVYFIIWLANCIQWPAKVFLYLPQEASMCILRVLYKTLWNYVSAIIWRDCHDCIGKIWTLFSHIVMLLLSREQSCQYYTCTLRQRFVNIAVYFFRADLKLVSIHDIPTIVKAWNLIFSYIIFRKQFLR